METSSVEQELYDSSRGVFPRVALSANSSPFILEWPHLRFQEMICYEKETSYFRRNFKKLETPFNILIFI